MNITALREEFDADPVALGYAAAATPEAKVALLNDITLRPLTRSVVPAHEVFEAIVPAEWAALSNAEKQRIQTILSMGEVNIQGAQTRASLAASFAAGTTTRANLLALQTTTQSRAQELGFGLVTAQNVIDALALP